LFKVDCLIQKRRENDKLLWTLMQSSFQFFFKELSGPKVSLLEACIINPPKTDLKRISGEQEVSFVPMSAITATGDIDVNDVRMLKDVRNGFTYFRDGDVVFAKISPSMQNGKGAIARNLKNSVGFGTTEFHVLRPIPGISNSEWLYFLTCQRAFRNMAEDNMTGSAGQQRVSSAFFELYQVVVPPIERQRNFADLVNCYYKQKLSNIISLESLIEFFSALSQSIFQGSFNINDISINVDELLKQHALEPATESSLTSKLEVDEASKGPNRESKNKPKKIVQPKANWDQVATETVANWIKEKYTGYYFNSEMLQRFLLEDHMTFVNYFSSEDLKKTPSLNSKEDLRKFLFEALSGTSPFLKLQQHFHNASDTDTILPLTEEDIVLFQQRSQEENSGIYFTVEEV
jgi:hypothetical protein